jgi:hypothetical protein
VPRRGRNNHCELAKRAPFTFGSDHKFLQETILQKINLSKMSKWEFAARHDSEAAEILSARTKQTDNQRRMNYEIRNTLSPDKGRLRPQQGCSLGGRLAGLY